MLHRSGSMATGQSWISLDGATHATPPRRRHLQRCKAWRGSQLVPALTRLQACIMGNEGHNQFSSLLQIMSFLDPLASFASTVAIVSLAASLR